MSTIKSRMHEYLDICMTKDYLGLNYESDAKDAYKYIVPAKNVYYVDPDLYSPLLYRTWGELLKKKEIIESYDILVKNYRYVIKAKYEHKQCQKDIILASDGLMSIGKCVDGIEKHKYIGGFALWPSHRGGINFRKNRYNDDIFLTLDDIKNFYTNKGKYNGVIPKSDYEWFEYLNEKGDFMDIFFFKAYKSHKDLLAFEEYRTEQIIKFLNNR